LKAFLLSAGLGVRLRPLTFDIPKCLVEINGKPLLYIWLDLLEREGVDEVLINTHYYAEKVEEAIKRRKNRINVNLYYEEELLGSGGTILANEDFVRNEKNFFFIFADNLSNVSLKDILNFHNMKDSLFTTYVYKTDVPRQKGIFVFDSDGKVLDFEEKPEIPKNNMASAGIGVLSEKVFWIFNSIEKVKRLQNKVANKSKENMIDFGKDIMPGLLSNMYVMETDAYIRDIGTLKDLDEARKEFRMQ